MRKRRSEIQHLSEKLKELQLIDDNADYIFCGCHAGLILSMVVWVMVSFTFMCWCIKKTERGLNDSQQAGGGQQNSEQTRLQRSLKKKRGI